MNQLKDTEYESKDPYDYEELDLKEFLLILWAGKWVISLSIAISAVASVAYSLSLPNIYSANALLVSAEQGGSSMTGLAQQYGGLASLAGISLPGGGDSSRKELGVALMKSRGFITNFVERRGVLPDLMAVKEWQPSSGIVYNEEIYDPATEAWLSDGELSLEKQPSPLQAYKAFQAILSVSEDKTNGYISVSVEHPSPIIAAQWVTWLIEDVNAAVRAQDVAEATRSIEYLTMQAANTPLADLKTMFFELIQSQTETVMLAEVRAEYVFKTVDPAVVPEEKSKPSRSIICIVGTFLGAFIGLVITIILSFLRSSQRIE